MNNWMDVERVFAITGEVVGLQNKLLSLDLEKREIEFKFNQMMINENYDFDTIIEIDENLHRINMEYMEVCDKLVALKSEISKIQLSMNNKKIRSRVKSRPFLFKMREKNTLLYGRIH